MLFAISLTLFAMSLILVAIVLLLVEIKNIPVEIKFMTVVVSFISVETILALVDDLFSRVESKISHTFYKKEPICIKTKVSDSLLLDLVLEKYPFISSFVKIISLTHTFSYPHQLFPCKYTKK